MSRMSLGIAFVGLIAAATVALAAGQRIVFQPRPGLEVPYRFDIKMKGSMDAQNGAIKQDLSLAVLGRFKDKVEGAEANGNRRISRTFTELKNASSGEEADVTKSLTDPSVTYTRDPRGRLLEVAGKEPKDTSLAGVLMGLMAGVQGGQVPGPLLASATVVLSPLFPYPESAIRAGMEWDPSRELVLFQEQKSVAAKVTVARIESGVPAYAVLQPQLAVDINGAFSPPGGAGAQQFKLQIQGRIELGGEQWAAVANGLIAKSALRGKATMSIAAQGMPMGATFTFPEISSEVVYDAEGGQQ